MEWTGPLRGLNTKTAGALSVTLWPSEGTAAGVWEEKEHRSSRPPSEPTKKVSGSQGDRASEVTPTVLLPRAYEQHKAAHGRSLERTHHVLVHMSLCMSLLCRRQ